MKSVSPYEYMDDWEKFDQKSLPEKEDFCSCLTIENTTDAGYPHPKRVFQDSEIKHLVEDHDLSVQSNTLLFDDVFENFPKMS